MTTAYPPLGFHFLVEFGLDGAREPDTYFREVSGINVNLETETVKEGGENRFTYQLPTRASYPDLVLKRGYLVDSVLISWCRAAIEQLDIQPVELWVKLLNEKHEPLQTYHFQNVWPKKWSISDFNAEDSGIVIETMELAYHYFRIVT